MRFPLTAMPADCFGLRARLRRTFLVAGGILFFSAGSVLAQQSPQANANEGAAAPILRVGAGPCMADFVVRDASGKGVYDAKITLKLAYGFMGLRKIDLNVGTNYEGKAHIEGLPEKIKRAADFKISQGGREKSVPYDPITHCYQQHTIVLEDPAASAPQ